MTVTAGITFSDINDEIDVCYNAHIAQSTMMDDAPKLGLLHPVKEARVARKTRSRSKAIAKRKMSLEEVYPTKSQHEELTQKRLSKKGSKGKKIRYSHRQKTLRSLAIRRHQDVLARSQMALA